MSLKFAQLQRAFRKLADVRLVSISVDPEHDTPEVLTAYADSYEADPERWLFLTGEKQTIINLAVNAFKISAGDDPQLHGTHFVLVDRQGRIRGFYRGSEQTALEQLKRDVRRLAQEPSP
jgi:protein SCO1/2